MPYAVLGLPTDLVHHLTQACVYHYWPAAKNIKYETCYLFTVPESLHRRLLVSEEDGSVFLLIVGTGEARASRAVPVVCIRGDVADANTDTRPMYGCMLTVTTPPSYVGGDTGYIELTWTLPSWDLPPDVDMEDTRYYFTPQQCARGLQGGSPGHLHYQVKC